MQVAHYCSAFYDKDQIGKVLLQKRIERSLLEWYSSNLILSRALTGLSAVETLRWAEQKQPTS